MYNFDILTAQSPTRRMSISADVFSVEITSLINKFIRLYVGSELSRVCVYSDLLLQCSSLLDEFPDNYGDMIYKYLE